MPRPRHTDIPNAIYFVTQVTLNRELVFHEDANAELFLAALHRARENNPFKMHAWAILPDHIHLLVQPQESARITVIVRACKAIFTQEYRRLHAIPGRVMMWQYGFYDHVIRDEEDYRRHLDYVHYNAVGHGIVAHPEDYRFCSFAAWKERGAYMDGWGWSARDVFGDENPLAFG